MKGKPEANYKAMQRFLDSTESQKPLNRLYWEEAPFILADPTEIQRRQAKKTKYVGRLKCGQIQQLTSNLFWTTGKGEDGNLR